MADLAPRDSVTTCDMSQPVTGRRRIPDAVPQGFGFAEAPPISTVVMFHGQRYELAAAKDAERRDGTPCISSHWLTLCARCAEPFRAWVVLPAKSPPRRCRGCRQVAKGKV